MITQQESLSFLRDLDIQFENSNSEKILLPGLTKVYEEWQAFCIQYDPSITDNYISSMTSIVDELNNQKDEKITTISEYKAFVQEYDEILRENLYKKSTPDSKKLSSRSIKDKQIYEEQVQNLKIKLSEIEDNLIKQVKNYEMSRQKCYTKCLINFLINNIEYHGQAVDNL